ncbi:CLUMA_CG010958, isoform A [Clunio marinus]|uniref:CLUMA_CG010958, isoform A n=1 Tax=Clunio marinus TaxID=568069 RepID=A0A1J1IDD6_9DIPT|nr:CLUMA_CG010958, isoform A [Clunio marinus]
MENLEKFKEWTIKTKKFPRDMNEILLERYLKTCEDDLVKAQNLLEHNLMLRKEGPQLFTNRDIMSEEIQTAMSVTKLTAFPKLTSENYRIFMTRIDPDPTHFDYLQSIRSALMLYDACDVMYDDEENKTIASGYIFIVDAKGMSFQHSMKAMKHFSTARLYTRYVQEAVPFVIKKMHVFNSSWVLDRMFKLFRPFIKKEIYEMINFHTEGPHLMTNYLPKEFLPSDYGGDLQPIDEIHKDFIKKIEGKREYLMNDDNWKLLQ